MRRSYIQILLLVFFIANSIAAYTQNFLSWRYADRYFSVSIGTGKAAYFGELNKPKRIQTNLANYSLGLEARLLTKIAARVEFGMYKINGADFLAPDSSYNRQRNLSFESWNLEATLQGVYYFKEYGGDFFRRWRIDPYAAIGVGLTTYSPKATLNGTKYKLRDFQTEDSTYGKFALIIPVSAGLKFRINEFINFNLELAFRYTFTDYLDNVSTVYPQGIADNITSLLSNRKDEIPVINPEAYDQLIPGESRGNPNNNDHYAFLNFKLEIFLPNNKGPLLQKPSAY